MQIGLTFCCRDCGRDQRIVWDTSGSSDRSRVFDLLVEGVPGNVVALRCGCGHVSGELTLDYAFREEHRPTWERR